MFKKIKHAFIEFSPMLLLILFFGGCVTVCINIDKPPAGSVHGTWTTPVSSPFQVDGRTCQSFAIEEGWMLDGKPTNHSFTLGRFVKCNDKIMNMEVPGKGGYN